MSAQVFDPLQADYPTSVLTVDQLVDLLHRTNAPDVVDAYRSAMQRGDRFPPICVVRLFGIWFVADGHKRFTAYRALGGRELPVEVWPPARWLRDQLEQGRATLHRWRTAFFRLDPLAPRRRDVLAAELAHLRRILTSIATYRRARGRR